MKLLSSRLDPVTASASAAVSQAAQAAIARGEDVIDLGLGEPDFDTPDHIIRAAHEAALAGQTRYTPTAGTTALRRAVVEKFRRENALDYGIDEVVISNGAKQILFNAMMATLEEGTEVILCAPYFGSYKDIVLILGGTPVVIECRAKDNFLPHPDALERAITPRTRWIILNLPSNPAGAVCSEKELHALGDVMRRNPEVLILSDEIYEHILFDGNMFKSFAAINGDLKNRTLTVNGVSKAYAMTGWRIGYGAGPRELVTGMIKVQSQISSGACSVAQAAATAALNGPQDDVRRFRDAFEARRDLVVRRVADIEGLTLAPPGGAFYGYIGCAALIGARTPDGAVIDSDINLTAYLLSSAGVAVVPGSAYELSPYFRISTAASEAVLAVAMDRIADTVARLELKERAS